MVQNVKKLKFDILRVLHCTESRESYFADAAYKSCSTGNETKEVLYWECSSRCKPVSVQDIVDTKLLFEGNILDMRKSFIGTTQSAVCRFVIPLTIQN